MRVVFKVGRNQPPRVDAETDKTAQEEDFHQTLRDSPLLGPAIQSCMEKKWGVNFLYVWVQGWVLLYQCIY